MLDYVVTDKTTECYYMCNAQHKCKVMSTLNTKRKQSEMYISTDTIGRYRPIKDISVLDSSVYNTLSGTVSRILSRLSRWSCGVKWHLYSTLLNTEKSITGKGLNNDFIIFPFQYTSLNPFQISSLYNRSRDFKSPTYNHL